MSRVDELAGYERDFRRAGLPLLIEDYSAREDVFTRAVPVLTAVFLAEAFGAIDLDWSVAANVGAVAGALGIVLLALGLVNRARGRPFLSRPDDVGPPELAGFVVLPALLPLVFGGQWRSALVTAGANLALLGLVYAVVGYGLLSIVRWAGARLVGQLAASLDLLSRALPLLLIFALVLFVNTEMWQVFADVPAAFLVAIFALFAGLGVLFLAGRLPREVRALERDAGGEGPPLETRQRRNVALVLFISQALQVLVVAAAVGAFFALFGALAVTGAVQESWLGRPPDELVEVEVLGASALVSEQLLRVAGGIAAFSGLYYAIAVLTDSTYREEFLEEITSEMRATFAARADYLRLRTSAPRP